MGLNQFFGTTKNKKIKYEIRLLFFERYLINLILGKGLVSIFYDWWEMINICWKWCVRSIFFGLPFLEDCPMIQFREICFFSVSKHGRWAIYMNAKAQNHLPKNPCNGSSLISKKNQRYHEISQKNLGDLSPSYYHLVMTNSLLLKIPHLVRWFTYSKWGFSIAFCMFKGIICIPGCLVTSYNPWDDPGSVGERGSPKMLRFFWGIHQNSGTSSHLNSWVK